MTDSTANNRWVLCIEKQRCLWGGQESIPEVDIALAYVLASYSSEDLAIDALKTYLLQLGAALVWSDVRPVEECAVCGKDINTVDWHNAVVLSREAGTEESPEILDVKYAARLCEICAP